MIIGFLGHTGSGDFCRNLNSLEDAVNCLKEGVIDALVIGRGFSSCPNTRDFVIFDNQKLYAKLKAINPKVNIIFI